MSKPGVRAQKNCRKGDAEGNVVWIEDVMERVSVKITFPATPCGAGASMSP